VVALQPSGVSDQQLPGCERPAGSAGVEAPPAERFGEHGPAEQRPEREQRQGSRRRERSQRDHASTASVGLEEALERLARRVLFDTAVLRFRLVRGERRGRDRHALRDERFVERAVHVNGPGRRADRGRDRSDPGVVPRAHIGRVRRHGRLEVGARVPPVEVGLVDRLVGAGPAEARRTVGGEHDDRRPRLGRLDDGREVLGGGRAARARERGRGAGRLRDAQREERRRALVQVHMDPDPILAVERERERGRPRSG
jgi:hypothetical protein